MSTYSFEDVSIVISHPSMGQLIINGEGIGSITTSMATEKTAHDVAADGSVMISKIAGENGTIALTMQQTSPAHKWMRNWYNHIRTADASEWASGKITVRSPVMQDLIRAKNVSPQKRADRVYQAQGQLVTWNLMAGQIVEETA